MKIKAFVISVLVIAILVGCGKKGPENASQTVTKVDQPIQVQTQEKNIDILNEFFFKDVSPLRQYTYKGTIWNDAMVMEGNKDLDADGQLGVRATLNVTEVAKLIKGKVYKLQFSIYNAKNNSKEQDQRLYLWVTKDKIYDLSPVNISDYKKFTKNGEFSYEKYVKYLEEKGQLPSTEKNYVRFSRENMKFTDESGLWETEIKNKDNICTYLSSHNSGHYLQYTWEAGKGLTEYSSGIGAMREGFELNLVEDNQTGKNTASEPGKAVFDNNIASIPQIGKSVDSFVPSGWKVLKSTQGDLNKDGLSDIAAVIEKIGTSSEASPRILFIAFGDSQGNYTSSVQSDKAILKSDEGGVWGDPFNEISVNRGSLLINFYGGSNWRWDKTYRFRYQNNGWYMIGATLTTSYTGTGESTKEDYNLITGDMIKTDTKPGSDKKVSKSNRGKKNLVNFLDFVANAEKEQF